MGRLGDDTHTSEKYTDRVKSSIQAAQVLALRSGNQQLTPLHVLKALLDDDGDRLAAESHRGKQQPPERVRQAVDAELEKLPGQGSGGGQIYLAPETARLFDQAEQLSHKTGDSFVTVEYLLLALDSCKRYDERLPNCCSMQV